MGKVVGRQPKVIYIAPSKEPSPWCGVIVAGERFTAQQIAALRARGLDPVTARAITVRRNVPMADMWWPTFDLTPVYEFECPIVGTRADGRFNVIAPIGKTKIVEADGWITPLRENRFGRRAA